MSLGSWWEERKRRQAEREALDYGEAEGEDVWADQEEEPEPEPEPEPEVEAEPVTEEEEPSLIPRDSWWKRRLLGGPEPEPEPDPEPQFLPDTEEEEVFEEPVYDLGALSDEELLAEEEPEVDHSQDEVLPPLGGDVPGPRRGRLDAERRQKRRRELRGGAVAAAVAVVIGLVGTISILSRDAEPEPAADVTAKGAEPEDTITTTLLFGTKEQRAGIGPTWMTLLSYDSATERAAIVYIPAHTATGVPGRGLLPVGDALSSGGVPLLLLATETLLGTPVDQYVELSDRDAAILLREIGPLTVDVPHDVRISAGPGQARLVFAAGPQRLSPDLLVDLLYVKGLDGDDVELGARHLAFWASLFEAFSFDADGLGGAVKDSGAALGESDATLGDVGKLFERLAVAEQTERALVQLPVRQVGVGGGELYQVDEAEVRKFLRDNVGEQAVTGKEVRVQILNGNGAPGIGQYVAERLGGEGFRVILSGNARRLNYRETLVITYDRSSKGVGLAKRTRDLIGVGEVQVAAQSQGIVDLTIVVGKDFLKTL